MSLFDSLPKVAATAETLGASLRGFARTPSRSRTFAERTWVRTAGSLCLVSLAYYAGTRAGMALTLPVYPVSTLWPPNAILMAALILAPPRTGWLVLLAAFPAHLIAEMSSGVPLPMVLCWFISNSAEAALGAACLRRFVPHPSRFDNLRRVGMFIAFAAFFAPFITSFLDAAFVQMLRWGTDDFWSVWRMRFLSNVLAVLALVPPIVTGVKWIADHARFAKPRRILEGLGLTVGLTGIGLAVFGEPGTPLTNVPALVYAPLPLLLWAAVRFGPAAVSSSLLIITLLAIRSAISGRGPFAQLGPVGNVLSLQIFLIFMSVPLMLLAAIMQEQRDTKESLIKSEKAYREVVDSQVELVCRYLPDTTLTFVNDAYCRFFGKTREELLGTSFLRLIPREQRIFTSNHMRSLTQNPRVVSIEHQAVKADGTTAWQEWVDYPAFDNQGQLIGFQGIGRDVTERHLNEESLRASHQQIRNLAGRLIHAQEEERRRIARELHDDFNQRLAAHAIGLSNLKNRLPATNTDLAKSLIAAQDEAIALSDEIRLIAHKLHPPPLGDNGLMEAFRSFCQQFGALAQLQVDVQVESLPNKLPPDAVLCCYRIVQEGLRNVSKHARATRVQVSLFPSDNRIFLILADDGIGIQPEDLQNRRGLGILGMRERVKLLCGEFHIDKRKTGGTIIIVELPIL